MRAWGWLFVTVGFGCTEVSETTADVTPDPQGCVAGERVLDDGTCQPAGVPNGACGEGFASDGDGGCLTSLPIEPCAPATTALPGDITCREIAPCGTERWPATDGPALYVDASASDDGNGDPARPFTRISDAITAASSGSTIAVAAGVYPESLAIVDKALTIAGRCPAMVRIDGRSPATITVHGEPLVTVRGVHIHGGGEGVRVVDGRVALEAMLITDTGSFGVSAIGDTSSATASLANVRIERATDVGLFGLGSMIEASDIVVTDTRPTAAGMFGRGVDVEYLAGRRATLSMRRAVVANSQEHGIYVSGADASLASVLVRDVRFRSEADPGRGINIRRHGSGEPSSADIDGCVVEGTADTGIYSAASAIRIVNTTVRDTVSTIGGLGYGVSASGDGLGPAPLHMTHSKVQRAISVGIVVFGAEAVLESVLVSDTLVGSRHGFGRALSVQSSSNEVLPTLEVNASRFLRSVDAGISIFDTHAIITRSVIENVTADADGAYGDGINIHGVFGAVAPAAVTLNGCTIAGAARAGVGNFAAHAVLMGNELSCNGVHLNGEHVDGTFSFDDRGDNACGCGEERSTCQVLSAMLTVPDSSE